MAELVVHVPPVDLHRWEHNDRTHGEAINMKPEEAQKRPAGENEESDSHSAQADKGSFWHEQ
ncbi:MAG: hypothetical protein ACAI35_21855 [Candidatus Methylacidiphilales bacterium]